MSEQGDGEPMGWQVAGGRVSLEALEGAFEVARQGIGYGNEPGGDHPNAGQPEVGDGLPGRNRPEPPWPTVVATTVRLWLRRKVALGRPRRFRWVITLAVAFLVLGGLGVAIVRDGGTTPATGRKPASAGAPARPAGQSSSAASVRHAVAVWVARQVSRDAMVACDAGMCAVLQAEGFPAHNLLVLRAGAIGLRFCQVIVATQAVRSLIGRRLEQDNAPTVIASFGSGGALIEVRAVAQAGAGAYRAALAADWAARRKAGAELVKNPRINAAGAARQELLAGKVDSRLLITLAELAGSYPVNVMGFGDSAPRAAAGVPLRGMEISGTGSSASRSAELQRIRSWMLAQRAVFRPAHVSLQRLADSGEALRIEFSAPSPLGLLVGRPVTQ
jgi:hypothetical protein